MKTLQVLVFVTYVEDIFAIFSGVYIDNGKNQTVRHESISRSEKALFEKGMLELLGLGNKPSRKARKIDLSASVTKFLLDLYNLMDGSDDNVDNYSDLKKTYHRIVEESDSIMTFLSRNDLLHDLVLHKRMKRLWFDVSNAPFGGTVIGAELRLFRDLGEYEFSYQHDITVTVFEMVKDLKGKKKRIFVDSKHVASDFEGWLVFNVTSAFVSWIAVPSTNYGLEICVRFRGPSKPNDKILPNEAGIIMAKYKNYTNLWPFVVAFFNSGGGPPLRSSDLPKRRIKRKMNEPEVIDNNRESIIWMQQQCERRSMYVNFKELGWHNWIVAPDGYEAYFCSGECDFPSTSDMNTTNHATLLCALNILDPSVVPKRQCAPKRVGPLPILYIAERNRLTWKRLEKMVVKSCGCV